MCTIDGVQHQFYPTSLFKWDHSLAAAGALSEDAALDECRLGGQPSDREVTERTMSEAA